MSDEEGIGGVDAKGKFWEMPELVEKLLPFLDLESINQMAKSHKLTRKILGKTLVWNQLIKRIFPKDHDIHPENSNFPQEDDAHPHHAVLASERGNVRLLNGILSLSEDSDRSQLGMDLLHTICERHPILDTNRRRLVEVGCSCGQTHTVSILGFLLLKEVQTREQEGILCVERVKIRILYDPPLMALSSTVAEQQGLAEKVDVQDFRCETKEDAKAFAALMERSQTVWQGADNLFFIFVEGDIGVEGWAAIRRAVELLLAAHGKEIYLDSTRKTMNAGKREDLKAIWEIVFNWAVGDENEEEERVVEFNRTGGLGGGTGGGWEGVEGDRRGLEAVIDMTDEEWLEELAKYGRNIDSEEENEIEQEEG